VNGAPPRIVVVNDASCLIDLRKAGLLHLVVQLPYRLIIPLPVRASELLQFSVAEWAILDAGVDVHDLPPEQVAEAMRLRQSHAGLSANDCFCLVTTRHHEPAILLTGDRQLRTVATADGRRVHGVLWVIDELQRCALCDDALLLEALGIWQADLTVRLPAAEVVERIRRLG
jgi:predicted nucleic acid-binding protein